MMDKDVGVELVDKNPNVIVLSQTLANGSSTMIHTYKLYDINGYTFTQGHKITRALTKTSVFRLMPTTVMETGKPTMGS
jgi:hypothetical protein